MKQLDTVIKNQNKKHGISMNLKLNFGNQTFDYETTPLIGSIETSKSSNHLFESEKLPKKRPGMLIIIAQ